MSDNTTNEANKHFRHYTFTKIESERDASIKNCNETNVITSRRFQHFKRWLRDNLLLIATICGVIFSLFLGEFAICMTRDVVQSQMKAKSIRI